MSQNTIIRSGMAFQKHHLSGTVYWIGHLICTVASILVTGVVAVFLYIVTRTRFHIQARGLHNFTISPSTIIAISHKRDLDEVVSLSTLHVCKTLFRPRFRIWIAARDDLFERGFLPTHFRMPGFVAHLLSWVNIAFIMKAIGALPIGRLAHNRTGRLLRDVYKNEGNKELKDILKEEWITKFASLLPSRLNDNLRNTRLKDFLGYEYSTVHAQCSVSGILKKDVPKRTRAFLLEQVFNQLGRFAKIMDDGGILFMTPGYDHSTDGRFSTIRSGIHHLIKMAQTDVRVLPVNITYDFLNTGQMRIHITAGPEITNLKGLDNDELEKVLRIAITSIETVNMGHLASYCLHEMVQAGSTEVALELLAGRILGISRGLSEKGMAIDNGVFSDLGSIKSRLRGFINYCLKNGWLQAGHNGRLLLNAEALMDFSVINDLHYSYNELMALQESHGINKA